MFTSSVLSINDMWFRGTPMIIRKYTMYSDYHFDYSGDTIIIVASYWTNGTYAGCFNNGTLSTVEYTDNWGSRSDFIINHILLPNSMWCVKNILTRLGRVYLELKIITKLPDIQDTVLCNSTTMREKISHLSVIPCLVAVGMVPISLCKSPVQVCFIYGITTAPCRMKFSVLCHDVVILLILGQDLLL